MPSAMNRIRIRQANYHLSLYHSIIEEQLSSSITDSLIFMKWIECQADVVNVLNSVLSQTNRISQRETASPLPTLLNPVVQLLRHYWHVSNVVIKKPAHPKRRQEFRQQF